MWIQWMVEFHRMTINDFLAIPDISISPQSVRRVTPAVRLIDWAWD